MTNTKKESDGIVVRLHDEARGGIISLLLPTKKTKTAPKLLITAIKAISATKK